MRQPSLSCAVLLLVALLGLPQVARGYSVLAHEAMIDAAWDAQLVPALRRRFPAATALQIREARAFAYGGSLIHDVGYYPFGNRLFSDLVHYVRSGDFIEALLRESRDVEEFAFALGALAHYASDTVGHAVAVNRVVPMVYPKLAATHGQEILYAASPSRHVMVEFAFDVLQVGRGNFRSDVYQELLGFDVAMAPLERAFQATYGLQLADLFGDTELAVGSFRRAASRLIPEITRAAWEEKRKDIQAATPELVERDVVYSLTPQEYEQTFGTRYRKPGVLARLVVWLGKVIPRFGPFKPLAFEPLPPPAARMFLDSFNRASEQYRQWLPLAARGALSLDPRDLDTGRKVTRGANPLADKTYDALLKRLAKEKFAGLTPPLRKAINDHYATPDSQAPAGQSARQRRKLHTRLEAMNAAR